VQFTWDAHKSRLNGRKPGISFDTTMRVFDDPYHVSTQDRQVGGEQTWQTIGAVAQTYYSLRTQFDEENGEIRIISARKAMPTERRIYAEGN
jgi:uncharacterized protein